MWLRLDAIREMVMNELTHSFPMHPFSIIGNERVNERWQISIVLEQQASHYTDTDIWKWYF